MPVQLNKGRASSLLDLTPIIDMVFNLLIFFMVITNFAKEERDLPVQLPAGSEAMPLTVKPTEIFVSIDKDGRYFVRSQLLTELELGKLLVDSAVNNPTQQAVRIRADERAPWKFVARAQYLCNQAGIHDYSAVMDSERKE
jgi:biopolymer transport protein ExbD